MQVYHYNANAVKMRGYLNLSVRVAARKRNWYFIVRIVGKYHVQNKLVPICINSSEGADNRVNICSVICVILQLVSLEVVFGMTKSAILGFAKFAIKNCQKIMS